MATYYSSPNNQREYLPNSYPDMMIYMGSEPYSENAALASSSHQNCIEIQPDSTSQHQQDILSNLGGPHDFAEWRDAPPSIVHGGGGGGGQGLSLSLGTQIPSSSQFRTHSPNGFGLFSSPNLAEQDYGMSSSMAITRAVPSSKYLKAAQQLLDEVVNVRKALSRQNEGAKSPKDGGDEGGSKSESTPGTDGDSSANNSQPELSHTERQDIQNKLTKLLSMLDEVDRRYKQYYHQMQIVVSSFDAIAGGGSAKPYTMLALQTISRHFRCLRDAITGQIKDLRKSLGEDDALGSAKGGGGGAGISRLRYVDQQLRQQRALQQLGMMQQHAWRPQRGLPETSVSILRAWLFEHFLHPYPKDSDKIMLARQTGLTRSQVSNWFINARVRLWKPMVEEMYKEETGQAAQADSNSSSENAAAAATKGSDVAAAGGASEETSEDFQDRYQKSVVSPTGTARFMDPKPDPVPPPEVEMSSGGGGDSVVGPADYDGELIMIKQHQQQQQQQQQRRVLDDCGSLHPDVNFHGHPEMSAAAAAYHNMSEMGRFGGSGGGGVSLTLGLQHPAPPGSGARGMAMPAGTHHFVAMRGHGDGVVTEDSSVGPGGADYEQPPRFGLLHDFVV